MGGDIPAHSHVRVAFLPMTPMLIPELAAGAAGELADLRQACRAAVDWAVADAASVLVLAPGPVTGAVPQEPTWSLPGFGLTIGEGPAVPLGVAVARYFLGERVPQVVAVGADPVAALPDADCLLVVGDGSATRGEKAPGHLDERGYGFDETVRAALSAGDAAALAGLDLELATAVQAAGGPVWAAAGAALTEVGDPRLLAFEDPYGVAYFAATWQAGWASRA